MRFLSSFSLKEWYSDLCFGIGRDRYVSLPMCLVVLGICFLAVLCSLFSIIPFSGPPPVTSNCTHGAFDIKYGFCECDQGWMDPPVGYQCDFSALSVACESGACCGAECGFVLSVVFYLPVRSLLHRPFGEPRFAEQLRVSASPSVSDAVSALQASACVRLDTLATTVNTPLPQRCLFCLFSCLLYVLPNMNENFSFFFSPPPPLQQILPPKSHPAPRIPPWHPSHPE